MYYIRENVEDTSRAFVAHESFRNRYFFKYFQNLDAYF